jgi:hypothetical protein
MGRNGTGVVLLQDKELFTVSQNPATSENKGRNSRHPRCSTFALHHWPLLVALISVAGPATGVRLGVDLNVSRSAPRGAYWSVADILARGALGWSVCRLRSPPSGARRGLPRARRLPGRRGAGPQGDRRGRRNEVELGATAVTVNGIPLPTSDPSGEADHRVVGRPPGWSIVGAGGAKCATAT